MKLTSELLVLNVSLGERKRVKALCGKGWCLCDCYKASWEFLFQARF